MRESTNRINQGKAGAMLLLCCVVVAVSGCALFELTPKPTDGGESTQDYYQPPEKAWTMQPATQLVTEFDGDGKVKAETRTEYAMPTSLKRNTFKGSSAFIEADRTYRFDSNPDGQGVEFSSTTVINEKALAESATAQVARSAQANELIASGLNVLGQVAGVYVNFLNAQSQRDNTLALRQVELEEARHAAEMAAMHHEEPAAPTEGEGGSGAAGGAAAGAAVLGAALAIDRYRKRGDA